MDKPCHADRKEKYRELRNAWIKKHVVVLVITLLCYAGMLIGGWLYHSAIFIGVTVVLAVVLYGLFRHRMMMHIEQKLY